MNIVKTLIWIELALAFIAMTIAAIRAFGPPAAKRWLHSFAHVMFGRYDHNHTT
ncbi:hypothetical protein [Rhodoplanes roseus]|uniref:hypothetical protein n=1 Tax=Rhodoplanes roseus TaxID=29409 RepID=UPI001475892F|nr:hypothetical protein [Rhodoplanes roseus]